jgi:hypothetical protein
VIDNSRANNPFKYLGLSKVYTKGEGIHGSGTPLDPLYISVTGNSESSLLSSNNTWTNGNNFQVTGTGQRVVITEMSGSVNLPLYITYTGGGKGLQFGWRSIDFPTDSNSAVSFANQGNIYSQGLTLSKNVNDAVAAVNINQQQGTGNILDLKFGGSAKLSFDKDGYVSTVLRVSPNGSQIGRLGVSSAIAAAFSNVAFSRSMVINAADTYTDIYNTSSSHPILFQHQNGGSVGIGAGTSPSAKLHVVNTTEQFRVGYDASFYHTFTVSSTGHMTSTATGTNAGWTWNPSGSGYFSVTGNGYSGNVATSSIANAGGQTIIFQSYANAPQTNSDYLYGGASTVGINYAERTVNSLALGVNNSYAGHMFGTPFAITEAASGTHAWVSSVVIKPTVITDGVATTTNSTALYISGAATGATNNYALYVASGLSWFQGNIGTTGNIDFAGYLFSTSSNITLSPSGLVYMNSSNGGAVKPTTTGIEITRNTADANTTLKVNQIHASSTGKILDLQFGGTSKASVDKDGYLSINVVEYADNAAAVAAGRAVGFVYRTGDLLKIVHA